MNCIDREKMIVNNLPIVNYVVTDMVGKNNIPQSLKEDLFGYGVIGLIESVDNYDSTKAKFITFAISKIKSAINEYLRNSDFLSRKIREKINRREKCLIDLQEKLERDPDISEICLALKMTEEQYEKEYSKLNEINFIDIDDLSEVLMSGESFINDIENNIVAEYLKTQINRLNEKEQEVINKYYFHDMTYADIAESMGGITREYVRQIHDAAIKKMKKYFIKKKISDFIE